MMSIFVIALRLSTAGNLNFLFN